MYNPEEGNKFAKTSVKKRNWSTKFLTAPQYSQGYINYIVFKIVNYTKNPNYYYY